MAGGSDAQNYDYPFLKGGGEMGELTRSFNWAASTLGEPGQWPASLKTLVSVILNSSFPQVLLWGDDLIAFYNDGYKKSLGLNSKHRTVGKPAAEAWADQWAVLGPMIKNVIETGEAVWYEDQLIPAERNGVLTDVYWTFSYSPAMDENGKVCGLHVVCTETTGKVLATKQLEHNNRQQQIAMAAEAVAQKKVRENERNLRYIILQAPVAIAIFRGPEYVVEIANARALEMWGRHYSQVFNKPILEAMPELKSQGVQQLLDSVYQTGETFSATELPVQLLREGKMETTYLNFVYEPVYNEQQQINAVITIGFEVTRQVLARNELQNMNEEMASANEELAAANEELVTTNEELAEAQENLHELLMRLSASEEKLLQAIETGNMGSWSINPATMEVTMSRFIRELYGFKLDGPVEMEEIMRSVHPDYHEPLQNVLKNAMENHSSSDIEYPITNLKTGERKWVRATGRVFIDADGMATEYSGMVMDITERKLDDLRKNDFIGMVSHELKTPLTTLSALIQVLAIKLKDTSDTFVAGAMDKASVQVKKMTNMINGFLNISRLESGKILIIKEVFELGKLVTEMIEETRLTVSSHHIIFNCTEELEVNADRDKIGSVISNLLSNAVKYSPKGKNIVVSCSKIDDFAQISVSDEGMGIKPQDLDKLFDRYYRVETKHTAHISGFGIGLYLSAEIIHRHNGKIWVESQSGIGSTFYFKLPLTE